MDIYQGVIESGGGEIATKTLFNRGNSHVFSQLRNMVHAAGMRNVAAVMTENQLAQAIAYDFAQTFQSHPHPKCPRHGLHGLYLAIQHDSAGIFTADI